MKVSISAVVPEIEGMGRHGAAIPAGVSAADQIDNMVNQGLAELGHVDAL